MPPTTNGPRVCSFESRRAAEMASLIERNSGVATIAPSMREIPLQENPAAFEFAEALLAGEIDMTIFLTGVGTRALWEVLTSRYDSAQLLTALGKTIVVVRGPKPTAVLREWQVRIDHRAPEPNTWRELLATLDAERPVAGLRLAVQEYGTSHPDLYAALQDRGAQVRAVPVYRWDLPEDQAPLEAAIRGTLAGQFDMLLFTSAQQIRHVLLVADRLGVRDKWLQAARQTFVGSIGPTCTEALVELGLPATLEPSHPKMGTLVREACKRWFGEQAHAQ